MEASIEALRHRGPDAHGLWTDDVAVTLGHTRLSIIDLESSANQPMHCARTGNVIVFNGEIYNYQALRAQLATLGWVFRTRSDTEVLLAAYGQWGANFLDMLNGMFAFAIYDRRAQRIVLARDRLGKKPLFYSFGDGALVWASEIKALFALCPALSRRGSIGALRAYMDLGYTLGADTIYSEVKRVPPAHFAVYDLANKSLSLSRYWRMPCPQTGSTKAEAQVAEELGSLLEDAVRVRLVSDVPLGVFLSGGLDSGIVSSIAGRLSPGLVAYTARFESDQFDESGVAAKVAARAGLSHHLIDVKPGDGGLVLDLLWKFDEPFADSSLLPAYLVSREIRQRVTVCLSGDGGDELFAGYDAYDAVLRESPSAALPAGLRRALGILHRLLPVGLPGRNFLRRLPLSSEDRFLILTRAPEVEPIGLLRHELQEQIDSLPSDGFRRELLSRIAGECRESGLSLLQRMTRTDVLSFLPDDVLAKVDRSSMMSSLEVRCPLLDYRIAEFASRLPDDLRYRSGVRKYLLKVLGRKLLPQDFPFERKRGFSIPEGEWIRGRWQSMFRDVFAASALFNRNRVDSLMREHARTGRHGRLLFRLFALGVFEQHSGILLG